LLVQSAFADWKRVAVKCCTVSRAGLRHRLRAQISTDTLLAADFTCGDLKWTINVGMKRDLMA